LHEPPPAPNECDVLVVMGGPMSVYDTVAHPSLPTEIDILREHIHARTPTFGICLGAQLLAAALGADVYPAAQKEIGWWPVELDGALDPELDDALDPPLGGERSVTAAEAGARHSTAEAGSRLPPAGTVMWETLLRRLPSRATVMQWHGDTFDLPDGAVRLGSTSVCPNQGFLFGDRLVATQFHLESTEESVLALTRASVDDIERGVYQIGRTDAIRSMTRGVREHGGAARELLRVLLEYLELRAYERSR
jgi:GMP synthase-like glutamine amidotransferase